MFANYTSAVLKPTKSSSAKRLTSLTSTTLQPVKSVIGMKPVLKLDL